MQQLGEREQGLWTLGSAGSFAERRTCAGQAQVKDNVGVAGKNAQLHTQQEDPCRVQVEGAKDEVAKSCASSPAV